MGSTGDSGDNALAETINRLDKGEWIHRRAPCKAKEALERATLEWVSWFNHHRLIEPTGYIPPAEVEANHCGQLASQVAAVAAVAARLKPNGLSVFRSGSHTEPNDAEH